MAMHTILTLHWSRPKDKCFQVSLEANTLQMHPTWHLALNIHETALVILSEFQGLKCLVHLLLVLTRGSNFHVSITLPMNPLLNLYLMQIGEKKYQNFEVVTMTLEIPKFGMIEFSIVNQLKLNAVSEGWSSVGINRYCYAYDIRST